MAKTIKFNLICNDYPVRNLEDLKNNFSIEDILEYYHNGLLKRWLDVRGYNDYLTKVSDIDSVNNKDIITDLIKIFELESDDSKIREHISILGYIDSRKELLKEYKDTNYKVNEIIDDYHQGYDSLIQDIIENKDDMAKIKANIKEIELNYLELFKLNYYELYNLLIEESPLAVFAILMNSSMREYYIVNEYASSSAGTAKIYRKIMAKMDDLYTIKDMLGKELKSFEGYTDAYWKDIEPSNNKYMLISMQDGNYIRNAGVFGEELSSDDVNGEFLILDGIDYKSNSYNDELLYMEV